MKVLTNKESGCGFLIFITVRVRQRGIETVAISQGLISDRRCRVQTYFNSPAEVVEANMKGAQGKAALSARKMILLGMLAGAFIALGGAASSTAAHGIADVGLARAVSGMIFPVGLMMVILLGDRKSVV